MSTDLITSLREKEALYRVTSAIIERTPLPELLQAVVDSVAEALPAERVVLITFDVVVQKVIHFVKGGTGSDSVVHVTFDELQHGLSGWVLREKLPALSLKSAPDPRELPDAQTRRLETNCGDIIVVPLLYRGKTFGTLTAINHFEGATFGQRQLDIMMTMARHSSVAINTAEYDAQLLLEIEERKRLEINLAVARDQALEASRQKSEFLANMSHEIRTPMNAILGLLTLLQSTELNARQQDYAIKTHGAAKFLLGLLNDILDFSKVEAGKMCLDIRPMRLDQILRNLSVILSASVGEKNIEVMFDIDPALPEVVLGDSMRLQQVLVNLGGNAVKFTEKGQVVLALRTRHPGPTADRFKSVVVEFTMEDSGIGIEAGHHDKIFSGFSQAESSTTRRFGGTGLGLAISQHMVQLMGSEIKLVSIPGVGSTFSFALELPVVDDVPLRLDIPPRQLLAPEQVLVVDDNARAGELTARMVRSWGWQVEVAQSGQQALDFICARQSSLGEAFVYPAMFIDSQMQGMDGWETAQRIRQLAHTQQRAQPLIFMLSGHGRETLARQSIADQNLINGFLVKPVTASMLFDAYMCARRGNAGVRQVGRMRNSQPQLKGMRILVVEDNAINQQVARELLETEGAIVSIAANGQLGVDAVVAASPLFDVVLMDLQMPVLDGYAATQVLRKQRRFKKLPIVAMTANAMASDRAACLAAGMNEHVSKPFDLSQLVSVLIRMTGISPTNNASTNAMETVPESLPALEIPGLDLDAALARMSGMRALYVRSARDFSKALETAVSDIQSSLELKDTPATIRKLHTLKGNAGTLGATALALQAAALEKSLKAGQELQESATSLQNLALLAEQTQIHLLHAIDQLTQTAPESSQTQPALLDNDLAQRALLELAALAKSSDLNVLQRYAELNQALTGLPSSFIENLDSSLQDLDLPSAFTLCEEMILLLAKATNPS
jgi:signal transduction histidine kinase/DNA-binding response OmpR family regulator